MAVAIETLAGGILQEGVNWLQTLTPIISLAVGLSAVGLMISVVVAAIRP